MAFAGIKFFRLFEGREPNRSRGPILVVETVSAKLRLKLLDLFLTREIEKPGASNVRIVRGHPVRHNDHRFRLQVVRRCSFRSSKIKKGLRILGAGIDHG